jgi:hypothetical protein
MMAGGIIPNSLPTPQPSSIGGRMENFAEKIETNNKKMRRKRATKI